ncbi:MAG: amidinotransferase, partial [Bacteroidetes bacterium]
MMIHVNTEIGTLKRLIIHSPDSGLGRVVPSKAQDWLFEDIVHLDTVRGKEYDYYVKILLYFLDPEKVRGKLKEIDDPANNRAFYKPGNEKYFNSDKVMDIQDLLQHVLSHQELRHEIIASICALENCSFAIQKVLKELPLLDLARTLISGSLPNRQMIFAPIPNLIFTRDIGIVINDHILLNKPAKPARYREALLARYVFYYHKYFGDVQDKVVAVTDDDLFFLFDEDERKQKVTTLEGGDIMMVAPNNLLVGVSERTTPNAIEKVIKDLFKRNVVEKVSVVKIPAKRDFMHIDTVFTQVKRNMWVLYGRFSKRNREEASFYDKFYADRCKDDVKILQFQNGREKPIRFDYIEDLLDSISRDDLKSRERTEIIYSGGDEFPFSQREQWTDSCNLLALKEGVVIGYDRNDKTADVFREKGFLVIRAEDLLNKFEANELSPETLTNTLIMLPSAELSRARGGS